MFGAEAMRLRRAVVLAGLAAATPAAAADLAMPNLGYPATQAPNAVEVGTNWYVRGDVGVAFPTAPSITLPSLSSVAFQTTTVGGANGSTAEFAGGRRLRLSGHRLSPPRCDLDLLAGPGADALADRGLPLRLHAVAGRRRANRLSLGFRPRPAPARPTSASTTTRSSPTPMSISEPTAASPPMSAAASART